ncbi:MAG: hypothetical protein ACLFTW_02930 [Chitinispirillaceae bacterium]
MSTKPGVFVPRVHYRVRSEITSGLKPFPTALNKAFFLSFLSRYFRLQGISV